MMEYFYEFLLFIGKFISIIIFLFLLFGLARSIKKDPKSGSNQLEIVNLNSEYSAVKNFMLSNMLEKSKIPKKDTNKKKANFNKNIFVSEFSGDIGATSVKTLRDEITAILSVAKENDEVVVILESAGGTVQGYGLGASQLQRIVDAKLKLTVVVDKIAASGGYLMACVANKIVAAPFAIIGSIGVVAQLPNFNKILKKNEVDFEQITAGKYKRTLTLFGENTDEARAKFQSDIDRTHDIFKNYVIERRPGLDIEKVATGEYWQAIHAKELDLVDELGTRDDIIVSSMKSANVFKVKKKQKKSIYKNLFQKAEQILLSFRKF